MLGPFLSIVGANMYEQLRLVGGLNLEKNGQFEVVCVRASLWNKDSDNAVRRIETIEEYGI